MASFIGKTIYGTDTEDPSLVNNSYDTVKKILGLGSIAGATYFGFKKPATQISNSLKNFSERRRTQLSETGFSIRESVLQSGETIDQIRRAALEEQAEKLTTDESIDAILKENSSRRKAVLQSVIDHLVTLEGTDTELQGFSKLKDELLGLINDEEQFDSETVNKIKSHIHGITTNENSRHRFLNSFRRYENVGHLISGARTPFQNPNAPVLESSLDSIFKGSSASSVKGKVDYRLGIIKRLQGSIEGFRVIDEFGSEAAQGSFKSIYAQVQFGGQTQMVPLHLQQSERGLSFIRTTRELSTRYSAPKAIMRAEKLLEIDKSSLSKADKIKAFEQEASRNIVDDLFDFLGGMRNSGQLLNFSRSQSNFVGERLRAFSEVVSAGVALPTGGFFDETTRQNILASHLLQSNKAIVTGIGGLPEREQRNLVSRLASQYSDFFDSTNAGATMRRTLEGPFGARESFTQITMGREFTPFSVMSDYADFDRTIMPTTARESQLIGRPEHFLPAIGKTDSTEVLTIIPKKRLSEALEQARSKKKGLARIGNIFGLGLGLEEMLRKGSLDEFKERLRKLNLGLRTSKVKSKLKGVVGSFDEEDLIKEGENIYRSLKTKKRIAAGPDLVEQPLLAVNNLFRKIEGTFLNNDKRKNSFYRALGLESLLQSSIKQEANELAIQGLERDGYRIERNEKGDFLASRNRKGFGEFFGFSEGAGKVKRFGSGSELLSISSRGEGIAGINMAAIMFADDAAARRAGLAEGMAYSGSDLRLRRQFTKTIDADAARFSIVEELLASDNKQLRLKGQKKIAEFFERNNNILGYLDGEQIEIPRFAGMEELKIAVSEEVEGSGKKKLKFSFEATEVTANNKAFSALVKGDLLSLGSNKEAFIDVLESGLGGTRRDAESMLGLFERRFGVSTRDSLISTFDMGTKGPKYATDIMYGGMRMMGFEESTLKKGFERIELRGDTAVSRQKQYLKDFTSAALDLLKEPSRGLKNTEEGRQLIGYLLGGMQTLEKEGKFGLKEGEIDKLIKSKLGEGSLDVDEIIRASKRGVIFGASSVFAGSSASILRSNLAKFEPRVANYLAENLRNIHGISDTEIADYMATFISRQQGSVEKMNMAPILKMMTSSMSPLANKEVLEKEILSLEDDFKVLKLDEIESLRASIGGGDKSLRQQLEILGRDKKAIGVDIDEYVRGFASTNKETKDAVAKHLKSRFRSDQLILPGQDVLENMIGMKIKTAQAGQEIEIENAFIRNLMAMKEQIRRATSAESADAAIDILKSGPFEQIITDVNATTGSIIRNIASGSVLGSATLQGQGIVLGFEESGSKGTVQSFSDFEDAIRSGIVDVDGQGKVSFANRVEARKAVQEEYMRRMSGAFNRSGGKALYLDTQAFMDATKTYMSAMEKSLAAEGVKAEEIPELAKQRSMETMKSFFYEMTNVRHDFNPVTGLSLRNPILGPSHLFPNMHLYRSDFFDNKKLFDALNVERFKSFDIIKRFIEEQEVDGKQRKFNIARIFDYLAEMESAEEVKVLNRGRLQELREVEGERIQAISEEIQRKENEITELLEKQKKIPRGKKSASSRRKIDKKIGILRDFITGKQKELSRLKSKDLTEEAMDLKKGSDITSRFFREFSRRYESRIGTGGGNIIFPAFDAEIEYRAGQERKTISTRFDITKFGIGDFDGDYYQLFIDTKQNMREITEGVSMPKQFAYGARFEVMMKQISSGMANIGERLNVSSLNIEDFLYSEAKKEEILKNVGGLDIEVKTAMLGMALDYESGAGDLNKRFNTLSFLTTAQEVLNIKAKKLPMASEVADIFALHLRDSFKTGSTQGLETFIRDQLFRDTEILEGIEIQGIKFQNVGSQTGTVFQEISDQASKNTRLSVDSIIEGLREAVQSVRTRGLDHLGSNRKIINLMSSDNAFRDMKAFQRLVQESQTLETALSSRGREQVDAVEELLRRLEPQRMTPGSMLTGKAGAALAGIMAGSYLLGNSGAPEVLNPQNTFSDYKVRNALQAQNAMSDGLDRAMNPAQTTAGMQQNIINRPINTGQYYTQTSNVRLSGNAPSMEAAYNMSSAISRSGGRSLVSINDTRQPITGNYIDRLLGE